jgi:hypothetical protein
MRTWETLSALYHIRTGMMALQYLQYGVWRKCCRLEHQKFAAACWKDEGFEALRQQLLRLS